MVNNLFAKYYQKTNQGCEKDSPKVSKFFPKNKRKKLAISLLERLVKYGEIILKI